MLGKYSDVKLEAFFFSYIKWAYYTLFQFHRLDYPGVGPEHSFLRDIGRAEYDSVTDQEALDGMFLYHLCFLVSLSCLITCSIYPAYWLQSIFLQLTSNPSIKC